MSDTQHFLLTRFNISLPGPFTRGLDVDWLEHRFDLFERFCCPSVRSQSRHNFEWLVFIDQRTPSAFRDRLDDLVSRQPMTLVIVSGEVREFRWLAQEAVARRLRDDTTRVLTSRLDNDDAIARDFMDTIWRSAKSQSREFMNFPYGYQLSDGRLYLRKYRGGPFVSRIEPRKGFRTVFQVDHGLVGTVGAVHQIEGPPAWLQVVHGRNLSTQLSGSRRPRSQLTDDGRFVVDAGPPDRQEKAVDIWIDRLFRIRNAIRRPQG